MRRFARIGREIGYTRSDFVHGEIYRLAGTKAAYDIMDFPPEEFAERIKELRQNYDGFNITKPYKAEILKYLDRLDATAEILYAANTVVRTADGKLIGYNTDAAGFIQSMKYHDVRLTNRSALILGAGGAARAVVYALRGQCRKIRVWNRTYENALKLNAIAVKELHVGCDVIINCTSAGLKDGECPIPRGFNFKRCQAAVDLIYNPRETEFIKLANQAGVKTANGAAMLFYQALRAEYLWQGITLPEEQAKQIIEKI